MSRNEKYYVLKNMLDEINARLDTIEEKINVLEDITIESTKIKHRKK